MILLSYLISQFFNMMTYTDNRLFSWLDKVNQKTSSSAFVDFFILIVFTLSVILIQFNNALLMSNVIAPYLLSTIPFHNDLKKNKKSYDEIMNNASESLGLLLAYIIGGLPYLVLYRSLLKKYSYRSKIDTPNTGYKLLLFIPSRIMALLFISTIFYSSVIIGCSSEKIRTEEKTKPTLDRRWDIVFIKDFYSDDYPNELPCKGANDLTINIKLIVIIALGALSFITR